MARHWFIGFILVAGIFFLGGCNTFSSRAKEMSAVFDALPPETQQRLYDEKIAIGDTSAMVYIAFGDPDKKVHRADGTSNSETWIYLSYYSRYRGSYVAYYETRYSYDAKGNIRGAYSVPVWQNYYDTKSYLLRQFTFVEDKVVEIIE